MARKKTSTPPQPPSPTTDTAAVWVPLSELKVWENNPRKNDHAVPDVAASIIQLGWGRPIVAREANHEIVAGHTARKAALSLPERWNASTKQERAKWHPDAVRTARFGVVPVRFVELDERRAHMLALADNKLNERAEWDVGPLLKVMEDFSFDELGIAGWEAEEIERMGTEILREGEALIAQYLPQDGAPALSQDERRAGAGGGDAGVAVGDDELEGALGGDDELAAGVGDATGPASGLYEVGDPLGSAPSDEETDSAEDVVPEPPKDPITKRGDVWLLGDHVLVCGASGSGEVGAHIPQDVARSLVTDPPYCSGLGAAASVGTRAAGTAASKPIANDNLSARGYVALMRSVVEQVQAKDAHMFTDWKMWAPLFDVVESNGLIVRSMVVWAKPSPGLGGKPWRPQHELVLYANSETPRIETNRGNVIQCKRQRNELHTTQKPVELMEELVKMAEGQVIVDSFAGSGTTLIACEKLQRRCFAVELDPAYCDVIVDRWEQFTGGKAQRKAGG